ncbi:MAG: hypothetical protein LUD29_00350, partial [Clostridia bacterium]|nr:hypothetical protein [Clostridia bacterium]
NYGFLSESVTLSEDTYTAVTVKVKVVGDATAYIYLTETSNERDVLKFEVPDYTFWYDDDGNVLKNEPDEDDDDYDSLANIAYELRSDGLYEIYETYEEYKKSEGHIYGMNEDSWDYLYSNLYIYNIQYYDENQRYFDETGEMVSWDNLDTDVLYYGNEDLTEYAPHYLVSTSGTRVFTYTGKGVGDDATYYYYYYDEDDETYTVSKDYEVKTFNRDYASVRYDAEEDGFNKSQFVYKITAEDCLDGNGNADYVTVSFFIHTGNEEKSYRLELWSGERYTSGVDELVTEKISIDDDGNTIEVIYPESTADVDGYVIFDYSYIELDETTYSDLMDQYVRSIISSYQEVIRSQADAEELFAEIDSAEENIAYYEDFFWEHNLSKETIPEYVALYYTFTLYDSAAYVPFNEETAQEEETGYDFTMSDFEETLAFFTYNDSSSKLYTTFIDYSTVNQEIEVNTISRTEDEDEEESSTNAWILAASIALVVVLLATLISMMVREFMKRSRIKRSAKRLARNQYTGRERLVRQYAGADDAPEDTPDTPDVM